MAGALGVTLSKRQVYHLVGGENTPEPDIATIQRALRVADICAALSVAMLVALKGIFLFYRRTQ